MFTLRTTFFASLGLGFLLLCNQPVHAATFLVTKTADTADGTCDADCSLREAVIAANATGGVNDITLPAGTYVLDLLGACENSAASGDLDIVNGGLGTDITINGSTTGVSTVDGNGTDRVFHLPPITSASSLTLNNVTVTNGEAQDCGTGTDVGGGIRVQMGSLVLDQSIVTMNNAAAFSGGGGGGISESSGSSIIIDSSTISENTTDGAGGGLGLSSATVTMINSTVSGNTANGSGGGLLTFDNDLRLRNVTISDNTADADGNNSGDGGGLAIVGTSGTATIRNTIIAANFDPSMGAAVPPTINPDCSNFGIITSEGYNLLGDNRGCMFTAATGDQIGDVAGGGNAINPLLAGLADNGGFTPTHALQTGSPAIDRGNNVEGCTSDDAQATVLTDDQRDRLRPFDGDNDGDTRCDVGAFELGGCGDGIVEDNEECDDGNTTDDDGCSATCTNEVTTPICGDGILQAGEECDDDNTTNGDGCSATCTNEVTTPVCGDGILQAGEACDDGNTTNGDGCDSTCNFENIILLLGDGGCQLNPAQSTAETHAGLWLMAAALFLALRRTRAI